MSIKIVCLKQQTIFFSTDSYFRGEWQLCDEHLICIAKYFDENHPNLSSVGDAYPVYVVRAITAPLLGVPRRERRTGCLVAYSKRVTNVTQVACSESQTVFFVVVT